MGKSRKKALLSYSEFIESKGISHHLISEEKYNALPNSMKLGLAMGVVALFDPSKANTTQTIAPGLYTMVQQTTQPCTLFLRLSGPGSMHPDLAKKFNLQQDPTPSNDAAVKCAGELIIGADGKAIYCSFMSGYFFESLGLANTDIAARLLKDTGISEDIFFSKEESDACKHYVDHFLYLGRFKAPMLTDDELEASMLATETNPKFKLLLANCLIAREFAHPVVNEAKHLTIEPTLTLENVYENISPQPPFLKPFIKPTLQSTKLPSATPPNIQSNTQTPTPEAKTAFSFPPLAKQKVSNASSLISPRHQRNIYNFTYQSKLLLPHPPIIKMDTLPDIHKSNPNRKKNR